MHSVFQESSQAEFSRSEGEVPARRDVVAALLTKIRSRPFNGKTRREARKQDMGANGSASADDGDLSPGELSRQNHNAAVNLQSAEESMDRPQGSSVFDSDENNNESERSGSLHEPQNEVRRNSQSNNVTLNKRE